MQPHTRIYFDYFDLAEDDCVLCEVCQNRAVDIHHIDNKGMGGSKTKDYIGNLIAVCRTCHDKAHDEIFTKAFLTAVHLRKMKRYERYHAH